MRNRLRSPSSKPLTSKWRCLYFTLTFWLVGTSTALACTEPFPRAIELADTVVSSIGCSMSFMPVTRSEPQVEKAIEDFNAGRFIPLATDEFAFSLEKEAFWISFTLENSGYEAQRVVIDFGRPYIENLHSWVGADTSDVRPLLVDGSDREFHKRSMPNRMIVSPAVSVSPGDILRFWAYVAFDGPARLPISIYPESLATEIALLRDFPLHIFISISGILLVTITAITLILRSRAGLFYAGFFACILAYNAQLSGLLFAKVWPSWPEWNALASHPIGLAAVIFALLFAREFTREGRRRILLRWVIRILIGVCVVFMAAPLLLPLIFVKSLAGIIILTFLGVQLWAAISAVKDKVPGSGFYFAGTAVLFAYLGAFTVSSQIEATFGQQASEAVLRHGQLLDGAIFCLAVLRQIWVLRERETSFRIQAARNENELASTVHDLRQPLLSMRVAIDKLLSDANQVDTEMRSTFTSGLSYIEGIISTKPADIGPSVKTHHDTELAFEDVPLQMIFDKLALMFVDEARRNGAEISVVETTAIVQIDALGLFRILSNLVSNAVQHSESDRILIGARRLNGVVAIDILDRGVGFSAKSASTMEKSVGRGLGLGIVDQLCKENGWSFELIDSSVSGTHLRVAGVKLAYT